MQGADKANAKCPHLQFHQDHPATTIQSNPIQYNISHHHLVSYPLLVVDCTVTVRTKTTSESGCVTSDQGKALAQEQEKTNGIQIFDNDEDDRQ